MKNWQISNDNGSTCRVVDENSNPLAIVFCDNSLDIARLMIQAPRMKTLLEKIALGDVDGTIAEARMILNLIGGAE